MWIYKVADKKSANNEGRLYGERQDLESQLFLGSSKFETDGKLLIS